MGAWKYRSLVSSGKLYMAKIISLSDRFEAVTPPANLAYWRHLKANLEDPAGSELYIGR
jgi:hypothetical protein